VGVLVDVFDAAPGLPAHNLHPKFFHELALQREFMEELGVQVVSGEAWCCVEHVYEHAHVRLYFYICREWLGEPQSLEGQAFAWQGAYGVSPLLPATIPLLEWLDRVRFPDRIT
jgi:8-oxo-dGTP diphosphatase